MTPELRPDAATDRLPFVLPDFTRHSWVADRARQTWEPRLNRIRNAWSEVEWRSVLEHVRPGGLVALSPSALAAAIPAWSAHHLSALGLPINEPEAHPGLVFAVVGNLDDVTRAHQAWVARDDEAVGRFLGYPDCCRAFFRDVWVTRRCLDTTWAMACNTKQPADAVVVVEPSGDALANILWRWLGVRAVPHLPCRFDCAETIRFGERLLGVAERAGYAEEAMWIREILSWPVEWSALHGIAELKTPILKLSTRTDATGHKYVVRWTGTGYPQDGATGLRFPYQAPRRPLMTEGRSFQLGLKRPVDSPAPRPAWHHADNGFSSPEAMEELHRPIVELARARLRGSSGDVLDLGCGNGALLAKICDAREGLTPHGIDRNQVALDHASELLPRFASHFRAGDLFDPEIWSGGRRVALALVMAGRLLEVERGVGERLLERLRERADAILLYVYPGHATGSLASVAQTLGVQLEDVTGDTAGILSSAAPRDHAIDWSRLAEPQADHHDTDAILRLAATASGERPAYRRTPVGDSPSLFDGQVAIRPVYRSLPEFAAFSANYLDAPADHPNLRIAAEHVRSWPVMFAQCQRLLEAIHPALDPRIPLESADVYRGSACHSYEQRFGTLWATIFCPLGLAEAVVHELAHQKLRVLGVSFESATAIVGNDPARRYVSPIVKDRERPMSAVLHAQYSYVHVAALDLHMLAAERDPARQAVLAGVLERNLSRIEEGRDTLHRHFEPGEHGREFMAGLSRWTDATIEAGRRALPAGRRGAPARAADAAALPLPDIDTSAAVVITPDRAVEVLSTFAAPRIVVLGNVLSPEECDALIAYCEPRLAPSPVIASADGDVQLHENRTSRDAPLRRGETAIVARIEARLAALARWPVEYAEGLQVVRYDAAQEYRAHSDWFDPAQPGLRKHLERGGQRLATFVLYLSDVEAGGETSFPEIGLRVLPHKGGAVFFVNTDSRYVPDPSTVHAGCPVVKGVKFVANKWLRQRAC